MQIKMTSRIFIEDDEQIIEFIFKRGDIVVWNVFYNIDGLSEDDLRDLQIEVMAKFLAAMPEVSAEDILAGNSNERINEVLGL